MSEFIQLHFLTAYPPSNLNRDDFGRPKTAMLGGVERLRVSSQCLKRTWRTSELFKTHLDKELGTRTKEMGKRVYERLVAQKVDPERAQDIAAKVAKRFGKPKSAEAKKKDESEAEFLARKHAAERETEQLAHFSPTERAAIDALIERAVAGEELSDKDYEALLTDGHGAVDIALFGRMLAASPKFNVEAAAQVAHAITVHRVAVEDDFFTAVDDLNDGEDDVGAGHMGSTEFGSGLFYHYVCVNRSLLVENLEGDEDLADRALRTLAEACATVAPKAKQNAFGSHARATFMRAERGEQPPRSLVAAFLRPVEGEDLHVEAVQRLQDLVDKMNRVYGACYAQEAWFDAVRGEGSLQSILDLVGGPR